MIVAIRDLQHSYKTREVLKGIHLEISAGEIFGLLGPNGSGKSTLFKILATVFPPTAGEVTIEGESISQTKSIREKIGVVFQAPSLDQKLTVWENLIHQGHLYGLSGRLLRKKAEYVLAALGIADRRSELTGKLSGGLKRRVEIAKGILHKPKLLILDEPSTGLDPGARFEMWKILKSLREREGITILLTTHLMEEAEDCGRLALLNEGKIIRLGSPKELKSEVGTDVVLLKSQNGQEALQKKIEDKFKLKVQAIDGLLQIEHSHGARLVTELVEAFPGEIESATFRRPTLEDVFMHHTGHRFWSEIK